MRTRRGIAARPGSHVCPARRRALLSIYPDFRRDAQGDGHRYRSSLTSGCGLSRLELVRRLVPLTEVRVRPPAATEVNRGQQQRLTLRTLTSILRYMSSSQVPCHPTLSCFFLCRQFRAASGLPGLGPLPKSPIQPIGCPSLLLPGGKDFDTCGGDPANSVKRDQRSTF